MILVHHETFPLAEVFTIARGSRSTAEVVRVEITRNGVTGQGECVPYARYGESIASVTEQITGLPQNISRIDLQTALPPGAARNAVDCALWDWQAKMENRRVWQLAGLPEPKPLVTAFTLSIDRPEAMQAAAARHGDRPLLKIKLGTPDDLPKLAAVRAGAPQARIIVDANEGWSAETYAELSPYLLHLGVEMVEQPLPAHDDAALTTLDRSIPVCADESCHDRESLPKLVGKYDMVNIKLDKTGGLTEALALSHAARAQGYGIMVGCMVGSSLAMAPATYVAQGADIVDLDGPLLLADDRDPGLHFEKSMIFPPPRALWG